MPSRLWIGGATDAGKTTQARRLAERHGLALYEYDRTDAAHHERLARSSPAYRAFLDASLDARWVETTPEALRDRALASFADRWPLVMEDLGALERPGGPLLVEGFGLTPDLVAPLIDDPRRAIWLLPTEAFKRASWARRNKPSFRDQLSDPERGAENLFRRDLLLGGVIASQAAAHGLETLVVDAAMSEATIAQILDDRFAPFLER